MRWPKSKTQTQKYRNCPKNEWISVYFDQKKQKSYQTNSKNSKTKKRKTVCKIESKNPKKRNDSKYYWIKPLKKIETEKWF